METHNRNSKYGELTRNLRENQLGGVIFGCNDDTIGECFTKHLFDDVDSASNTDEKKSEELVKPTMDFSEGTGGPETGGEVGNLVVAAEEGKPAVKEAGNAAVKKSLWVKNDPSSVPIWFQPNWGEEDKEKDDACKEDKEDVSEEEE